MPRKRPACVPLPAPPTNGTAPPLPDLLTIQQVAKRLQLGTRAIRRWVSAGRLPKPVRFTSHCVRWRRADIDAFINAQVPS